MKKENPRVPVISPSGEALMLARGCRQYWTPEEDALLISMYGKQHISDLLILLPNRTKSSVNYRARKLKIKANLAATHSKYSHDRTYFAIPSLENSYYAGFITADGCVYPPKNTLKITLNQIDEEFLLQMAAAMKYTGVLLHHAGGNYKKESNHVSLAIYNASDLINDLKKNFNILQKKTLILDPPSLEGENALAFLSGYLDGDGSVFTSTKGQLTMSFRGTENVLRWIKSILDIHAPHEYRAHSEIRISNGHYQYKIRDSRARGALSLLSNLDIPRLKRKRAV